MPKVPNRPLSAPEYGFRRISIAPSTEGVRDLSKPTYSKPQTSLPHPFKCSKCEYTAADKTDFNDHWSLEH